jgi:hypothetical protein
VDDPEVDAGHPLGIRTCPVGVLGHWDLGGDVDEQVGSDVEQGD